MVKKKRLKDYTKEDLEKMSYSEREKIQTLQAITLTGKILILTAVIIFIIITFFNCFKSIPTGFVGVKTQFGKVQDTMLNEGINFKLPYIEKITLMDCRTKKYSNTEAIESSTSDSQVVRKIFVSVNYSIDKSEANKLYQSIGTDYVNVRIIPNVLDAAKWSFSQFTADELNVDRNKVTEKIKIELQERLKNDGINIIGVTLDDFDFSDEYNKAIEQKAVAQQQVETAKALQEKAKIENETKIENAKTEAEIMRQQNSQITEQALKLKELEIQQKFIEKWNGNLPSTMLSEGIQGMFNIGK